MKYPNIEALVPAGEHFDSSAMNNEGIWLTPSHVDAIEVSLSQATEAGATAATQISELNGQVENLNTQLQSSAEAYANAQAELGHKDAEIENLNAQIVELKNAAAGGFQNTTKEEDGDGAADPKEKYLNSEWSKYAAGFFS